MNYSAIILAAGSGARSGLTYNKVLHKIHRRRVLDYSVNFFQNSLNCNQIILVSSETDYELIQAEYSRSVSDIIIGGKTRQESVYKALSEADEDYVLIHDGARPYLNSDVITNLLEDVITSRASTLAISVSDTIVKTSGNRLIKTLDRTELVRLQTPQAFLTSLIRKAHEKAKKHNYFATDDTDLVRKFTNVSPTYVKGDYRSVKLTTEEDIALLEVIL